MTEKKPPSIALILAVSAVTLFSLYRVLTADEQASPAVTVMSWIFIVIGGLGVVGLLLSRR